MFPAYVDVRRAPAQQTKPDRARTLDDGDHDDPPSGATLLEVIQDHIHDAYRDQKLVPPPWTRAAATDAAVDAVWQTVPLITELLIARPETLAPLCDKANDLLRQARWNSGLPMKLTARDEQTVDSLVIALNRNETDPTRNLFRLTSIFEYVTTSRLSQSDAAQLVAGITHRVATNAGKQQDRVSSDAHSARLQILAETFAALDADQQSDIGELAAALANHTPTRTKSLRNALRRFIEHALGLEDLVYFGHQLTTFLGRWASSGGKPERAPAGKPRGTRWSFAQQDWCDDIRDTQGFHGFKPTTDTRRIRALRAYVTRRAAEVNHPLGQYVREVVIPELEAEDYRKENGKSVAAESARRIFADVLSDESDDADEATGTSRHRRLHRAHPTNTSRRDHVQPDTDAQPPVEKGPARWEGDGRRRRRRQERSLDVIAEVILPLAPAGALSVILSSFRSENRRAGQCACGVCFITPPLASDSRAALDTGSPLATAPPSNGSGPVAAPCAILNSGG